MSVRKEVLGLYRRILRLSRTWQSASGQANDTRTEKRYITEEAKMLFRKNQNITDENEIREHIKEAHTRIELALHYKTPYPRHVNIPQNVLAPLSSKVQKAQKRKIKESIPVYWKSYDDK
ncbi:LYR motif-containing protein 1-like [Ostrea edulis]|uniref:LYR motif-containing protein 1-like n=1 Tax=Ostrea edulis TaxID=37623 RepID=UPI002094BA72|nr:LYR motif-containing protein 1-like [Ostrea edulis]